MQSSRKITGVFVLLSNNRPMKKTKICIFRIGLFIKTSTVLIWWLFESANNFFSFVGFWAPSYLRPILWALPHCGDLRVRQLCHWEGTEHKVLVVFPYQFMVTESRALTAAWSSEIMVKNTRVKPKPYINLILTGNTLRHVLVRFSPAKWCIDFDVINLSSVLYMHERG